MKLPACIAGPQETTPAARMLWLDEMITPAGRLVVGATVSGVALLHFAGSRQAMRHLSRLAAYYDLAHDPARPMLAKIRRQLAEYFAGHRCRFDVPVLTPVATPFQRQVWQALLRVPYGRTIAYGELAARIGRPTAVRAVAAANAANPVAIIIPCHRVIAADGSLGGYAGGLQAKRILLDLERRHAARVRS